MKCLSVYACALLHRVVLTLSPLLLSRLRLTVRRSASSWSAQTCPLAAERAARAPAAVPAAGAGEPGTHTQNTHARTLTERGQTEGTRQVPWLFCFCFVFVWHDGSRLLLFFHSLITVSFCACFSAAGDLVFVDPDDDDGFVSCRACPITGCLVH